MNYSALAATANKLIEDAGQAITLSRYTVTRSSTTGVITKGAAVLTVNGYAIEVPVTQGLIDSFAVRLEAGELVQKTLRAFKIAPSIGAQPQPRDEITLTDGSVWPVVGCTPINPAGTPLCYTVGVAK
jgi:hypothetical protein